MSLQFDYPSSRGSYNGIQRNWKEYQGVRIVTGDHQRVKRNFSNRQGIEPGGDEFHESSDVPSLGNARPVRGRHLSCPRLGIDPYAKWSWTGHDGRASDSGRRRVRRDQLCADRRVLFDRRLKK